MLVVKSLFNYIEDLVDEYGGIDIMEGNEGHFCIVWVETSRIPPFMSSIFHLVLLITFSAIAKTTLIFHIFTLVDSQPLNIFSFAKL